MKIRATLVVLLGMALLAGMASSVAAEVYLDAPHNSANGIVCYLCHSADPTTGENYWFDSNYPADPDFSRANWVCLRCHSDTPTILDPKLYAPVKVTHSKTTTGSSSATDWTNFCTDCHDPHFQTQKDTVDADGGWLAQGTIASTPSINRLPNDFYDQSTNIYGGGANGTTEFNVDMPSAPLIPIADWGSKGKGDAWAASRSQSDGSRGLLFVSNRASASTAQTFEIIHVTDNGGNNYTIKVNGDATIGNPIQASVPFGVTYGDGIRSHVPVKDQTTGAILKYRKVKFYTSGVIAGSEGGTVDLSGNTEPTGICQVCHTTTAYYDNNVAPATHYADGSKPCSDCHQIIDGGEPQVDHSSIISAGVLSCPTCHYGYDTSPDNQHVGNVLNYTGCQTCHTNPDPLVDGIGAPNLRDPDVTQRTGTTNTGSTHGLSLICTDCHNATWGSGDYTTGHPSASDYTNTIDPAHAAAIAPQSLCVNSSCHGSGTLTMSSTGADIVADSGTPGGHSSNCTLCHITVTPSPVQLTPDAQIAQTSPPAICSDCHTGYFDNHQHGTLTGSPNHTATVIRNTLTTPNRSNCASTSCHYAPAGNGPFVGPGEVHSLHSCDTCHDLTGPSVNGSLRTTSIGDAAVNGGTGGECVDCHFTYFDAHLDRAADTGTYAHDVSFNAAVDKTASGTTCNTCHRDYPPNDATSLDTWSGILYEHDRYDIPVNQDGNNVCTVCHDYTLNRSGDPNTPTVSAVTTAIGSNSSTVTCTTCHQAKLGNHGSHTDQEFMWDDITKTTCGTAGCHDWVNNQYVALDIHGNKTTDNNNVTSPACPQCHVNAAINDYTRRDASKGAVDADATLGTAGDRTRNCLVCHDPATYSKPKMHHVNDSTLVTYTVTNCATKCHKTGGYPADHYGNGSNGMVNDAGEITDVQKACSTCHSANIGVTGDGNNVPVDGTSGNKVHDACTTCHYVNTSNNNMVELVAPTGSATAMPDNLTVGGTDGGGTCTACHENYFEAHTHHNVANQIVHNTTTDQSWDLPPRSCETCHHDYDTANSTAYGLGSFDQIKWEHDRSDKTPAVPPAYGSVPDNTVKDGVGSCVNCHYHDSRQGVNTIKYTGNTVADVVSEASTNGWTVNCLDCHYAKETPSVHGLTYINHLETNLTAEEGTSGLYPPIARTLTCASCHPHDVDLNGGPDPILDVHKNPSCDLCHTSQPLLKTTSPNLEQFADGNSFYCNECHQTSNDAGFSYPFHGMTSSDSTTISRHNNLADSDPNFPTTPTPYNCQTCHMEMYDAVPSTSTDKKIARHPTCETCHTAPVDVNGNDAVAIITANVQGASSPSPQPCESCHIDNDGVGGVFGAYTMHPLAKADVITDNLHDAFDLVNGATNYTNCKDCHAITSQSAIITLHNDDCTLCHGVDNPTETNINYVITNNSSTGAGAGTAVNCEDCHNAGNSIAGLLHGLSAGTAAGVHDQIGTYNPGADTDCANCHTMGTNQQIIELHTVTTNPATTGSCLTCHNPAVAGVVDSPTNSLNTISSGETAGGSNPQTCYSCHGTSTYKVHGLAFDATLAGQHNNLNNSANIGSGTETDCDECHNFYDVTPATNDLNQLNLHSGLTNPCSACHTAGVAALGDAPTTIYNGWLDTGSSTAECEDCHAQRGDYTMHGLTPDSSPTTGVVPDHDHLLVNVGLSSDCKGCHAASTVTEVITVHPANPTNCLACHKSIDTAVIASISAGADNATPADQSCQNCHNGADTLSNIAGDWYNHLDPDHTVTTLNVLKNNTVSSPNTVNCVGCHTASPQVAIHDSVSTDGNACDTCHPSSGLPLQGSATAYVSGTAECITCHGGGSAYFDSHTDRSADWGSTYSHVVQLNNAACGSGGDCAQPAGTQYCWECHDDANGLKNVNAQDQFTEIITEHSTVAGSAVDACETCHNSTRGNGDGTVDEGKYGANATVQDVISSVVSTLGDVQCLDCHYDKRGGFGHGGHDSSHFDWTQPGTAETCGGNANTLLNCHGYVAAGNPVVVDTLHNGTFASGYTSYCKNCHDNDGGGDNTLWGIGLDQNGRAYNLYTQDSTTDIQHQSTVCTDCHSGNTSSTFDGHLHDHSSTVIKNTLTTPTTSNCTISGCHVAPAGNGPFVGTGEAHAPSGCQTCHNANGGLINGTTGDATVNSGGGGECVDCHSAYFDGHVGRDVDAPATNAHAWILNDTQACGSGGDCGQPASPAYCWNCHDDTNNLKNTNALDQFTEIYDEHSTVQGSPVDGCETCHNSGRGNGDGTVDESKYGANATVLDVIATATPSTVQCLDCHYDKRSNGGSGHGGHAPGNFAWSVTCGTSDCHDSASNTDIVSDVHGTTGTITSPLATATGKACENCHDNPNGGTGTTIGNKTFTNGFVGQGVATSGSAHTETCTTCHGGSTTAEVGRIHHERYAPLSASSRSGAPTWTSRVQAGNCHLCHTDGAASPGVARIQHGKSNGTGKRPTITPCIKCHIVNDATYLRIKDMDLTRVSTTRAAHAGPQDPWDGVSYAHEIPNYGTAININDTGVCFYCHGDESDRPENYGATPRTIYPQHAWTIAMIQGNETDAAQIPRIRMGLHPGHYNYRIMASRANNSTYTTIAGTGPMYDRNGNYNFQIYKPSQYASTKSGATANDFIDTPQDLSHGGNLSSGNYAAYVTLWGQTKLQTYLGSNFSAPIVTVTTVPYNMNGGGGPYTVPAQP